MPPMTKPFLLLCLLVLGAAHAAEPPTIAIVGAYVLDVARQSGAQIQRNQTIVIEGNRIVSVGPAAKNVPPKGATVIDGKGKWVIPGLIDSHVHFSQSGNLYTRPDAADFNKRVPYLKEDARNKARLPATFKAWLASGVTSVVDLGGPMWNFKMRDAARASAAAPRVAVAGPLISMVDDPFADPADQPIIKVTTPDEARAEVARQLPRKPDYVKVWFIHRKGDDLAAQEAIVKAAGDAAHAAGVRFAVHATELAVAKAALRAGADYLVHSVTDQPVDDEFIDLALRNRALYSPTLFVFTSYELALSNTWRATEAERRLADPQILATMGDLEKIPKDQLPARVAKWMANPPAAEVPAAAAANLLKVSAAGIPVVMGTDAGNIGVMHGPSVFREMEAMQKAGMAPMQVLRSATVSGAKAMGMEKELGMIAPGALADLLVLDADPRQDLQNLSRIHRVIKDGKVFDPAELIRDNARLDEKRSRK